MLYLPRILVTSRCALSQSAAAKSARGGSQSAVPATKSARQEQVKTLITMEERTGDHRRPPPTTQQPEPLTEHGGSQSAVPATNSGDVFVCCHKVLRLPRNLHMEVHKVLCVLRNLHVKKQVKTLITMEERTGDHRRPPPTTQQPEPLTEHGGSQSAVPATNSGDVSVCVVTKCCACQEIYTWRCTKRCACRESCT